MHICGGIVGHTHQRDLYHVFIDFKEAFNRVWHAALLTTVKKYSISTNII